MNLDHPQRRPQKPWTPELERRHVHIESGEAHVLGRFLDALAARGIVLARWVGNDLYPAGEHEEATIAAFYDLDLDKIELEKRALLAYMRALYDYENRKKADE